MTSLSWLRSKTHQWRRVILPNVALIVVLLVVAACSTVTVEKVPTPSQYVVWTDRMQAAADDMEGLRFYLPRPFLNVFESFPVRTDIYLAEGVVSADGRFVIIRHMWDENGNSKFPPGLYEGLAIESKAISTSSNIQAQGGTGDEEPKAEADDDQAAATLPGIVPQPTAPSPQTTDASTGQDRRGVSNDNSAYAYQPMRGNMDLVYLPDFDEQYVVSSSAGLGDAEFQINLGQGWSLQGFNSLADNSRLNDRIFDIIDSASQIAKSNAFAAARLPPVPAPLPGTTAIAPQSGTEDSTFVAGTPVSLKIVIVHYAAKGLYPIIKPRELQQRLISHSGSTYHLWFDIFNWVPLTTPSSTFDTGAITRAQQSIANVTGKFSVPRYPYQFISFSTFRYMAIETLTPGAHPFGTLYDKTGTQGDPGDRRLADPPPATPGLPTASIPPLTSDEFDEKKLLSLAKELGGQDLDSIKGVTYIVLRMPQPIYEEQKLKVYLSEQGTPTEPIEESEVRAGILNIMTEPGALTVDDIVIVNKDDLKTIPASSDSDDANQGNKETQSGQPEAPESPANAASTADLEIEKLQTALCLRGRHIDGIWGPQTRQMLIKYQSEKGLTPDADLSQSLRAELLKLSAGEIGARCASPTTPEVSVPAANAVE